MKKIILILLIVLPALVLLAVFDDYQPSARARGMGNAYTGYAPDANALFYNPAGLAQADTEVKIGFSNLANQKFTELKTAMLLSYFPKLWNSRCWHQNVRCKFRSDKSSFEQNFALGYAYTLQKDIHSTINFGVAANYYRLVFDEDEEGSAFGLDLGALAILHQRTRLGFAITNINQPTLGDENQNDLPRKLSLGISYVPYDRVVTSLEVKKDFEELNLWAEWKPGFRSVAIRVVVHQTRLTARSSFYVAGIEIDYYTLTISFGCTHYINVDTKSKEIECRKKVLVNTSLLF